MDTPTIYQPAVMASVIGKQDSLTLGARVFERQPTRWLNACRKHQGQIPDGFNGFHRGLSKVEYNKCVRL